MLPARHRLRTAPDFRSAVRGRRARGRVIVVHAHLADASGTTPPRVGFVVSKAVGNAVTRNRVKRRLRALMSARVARVPAGTDVVIRANPAASRCDSADLARALDDLLPRVLPPGPGGDGPRGDGSRGRDSRRGRR